MRRATNRRLQVANCRFAPRSRAEFGNVRQLVERGGHCRSRHGLTLIELLVVISLLVIMAAAVLPRLKPAMEGRRVREGARVLHVYLSSARATAIATGRSCGIMIDRLAAEPRCAMTICQVQVPLPYNGDDFGSTAQVSQPAAGTLQAKIIGAFNSQLVAAGDRVQFNCQGPWHRITSVGSAAGATSLMLAADLSQGQLLPWTNVPSKPVSYRILRRAVKAGATPLQLPASTVIDLQFSGPEGTTTWATDTGPIYIMFSPNGGLDAAYNDPTQPTYLLIGRRELVGDPDPTKQNVADLANLYIGVNPQTGLLTTENIAEGNDPRAFVRQGQNMGGR
jgi:prepilin-type N-terminal cleavage/methylation domain-containing protein